MRARAATVLAAAVALEAWLLVGPPSRLEGPSQFSWSALDHWYEAVGPARAAAGALRGLGVLAGAWLLVALGLQVASAAGSLAWLRSLADSISPRSLQRLGQGLAGLSLTAGLSLPAPGAGIPLVGPPGSVADGSGTATLSLIEPEPPATGAPGPGKPPDTVAAPGPSVPGSTSRSTDPEGSGDPERPDAAGSTPPVADEPARRAEEAPTSGPVPGGEVRSTPEPLRGDEVAVEPGDSFWSLAVAEVGSAGAVGERAVARYWLRLIEANRDRLVDPANPDLIYPGQRFVLPSPAA